jgi:hypothetical protein
MLAIISAKGKKQHVRAGRVYFLGMLGIFITAIPMALVSGNQFLFITAIFSFYLAFAGLRFARNRTGVAATVDWIAVLLMLLSGVGLWLLAAVYFIGGNADFVIPVVFGTVALALGFRDYRTHKNQTAQGPQRIAGHLSNMLGGNYCGYHCCVSGKHRYATELDYLDTANSGDYATHYLVEYQSLKVIRS